MARRPRGSKSQATEGDGGDVPLDLMTAKMRDLEMSTEKFGQTLSKVLAQGIARGRSFDEILRGLGQKFIEMSLRMAFKPIEGIFGGFLSSLFQNVSGAFSGGGGISNLFSGLFGGGGATSGAPAASGAGGMAAPSASASGGLAITMNITTPDAESFRRSEAQVSAALARAVARGQRSL